MGARKGQASSLAIALGLAAGCGAQANDAGARSGPGLQEVREVREVPEVAPTQALPARPVEPGVVVQPVLPNEVADNTRAVTAAPIATTGAVAPTGAPAPAAKPQADEPSQMDNTDTAPANAEPAPLPEDDPKPPKDERNPISDDEMLKHLDDTELAPGEFEKAFADQRNGGVKLPGAPGQ